jgi:hypothetical protein
MLITRLILHPDIGYPDIHCHKALHARTMLEQYLKIGHDIFNSTFSYIQHNDSLAQCYIIYTDRLANGIYTLPKIQRV